MVRNWFRSDEKVASSVRELREFAATLDQNPRNIEFELQDKGVTSGYAAWSVTYDQPDNPLVSLEQPIVRSFIEAISRAARWTLRAEPDGTLSTCARAASTQPA